MAGNDIAGGPEGERARERIKARILVEQGFKPPKGKP